MTDVRNPYEAPRALADPPRSATDGESIKWLYASVAATGPLALSLAALRPSIFASGEGAVLVAAVAQVFWFGYMLQGDAGRRIMVLASRAEGGAAAG